MSEVKKMTVSNSNKGVNGTYVRVEDYVVLKAERDALAAENLAIKSLAYSLAEECAQTVGEVELTMNSIATPATDVYANQLRAEGVEMFAKHFNCADISDDILEFAANLRKENGND